MGERPGRSALPVFGSRSDPARLLALHFHFILIIQLYNNSCEFVAMNARSRSSIRVPSFSIINFCFEICFFQLSRSDSLFS